MKLRFSIVLAAALVLLALQATSAHAFVRLADPVHRMLVFLHILGAIIFMGNIIVSAMWMSQARRTRDAAVLEFATRAVIRADWLFTLPGIVLILVPGLLTVGAWGGIPGASWAEAALALFIVSGVIWGVLLVRFQKRMAGLAREAVELNVALSDHFYRLLGRWMMWGGIATLLPLVALYLMVFKPELWG